MGVWRDGDPSTRRRAIVVGCVVAAVVAVPVTALVALALAFCALSGNASLGGLGAAAMPNTRWWAFPVALAAFVAGIALVIASGFFAGRRFLRWSQSRGLVESPSGP